MHSLTQHSLQLTLPRFVPLVLALSRNTTLPQQISCLILLHHHQRQLTQRHFCLLRSHRSLSSKLDDHPFQGSSGHVLLCRPGSPAICFLPLCSIMTGCHSFRGPWSSSQFQVAINWWLGLEVSYGSCCPPCPEIALDPLGHHAVTCKRGGDVVSRHNKLRDDLAESCRLAHLGIQMEMGRNVTSNHNHNCPADCLVPNWVLGKLAL